MKISTFLIVGFLFFTNMSRTSAQCAFHSCDPQLTGLGFNVECINLNGQALVNIGWFMGGGDNLCTVPPGSWRIQLSLPLSGIYGSTSVSDVITGPGFDWTYNSTDKTFTGTNNVQMAWLSGGNITINVTGLITNTCTPIFSQANLQIVPSFQGGCPQAFGNQISNDALSSGKGVQVALPILLTAFKADPVSCNSVELDFTTAAEVNNDYIELQRSTDGTVFTAVTRWEGSPDAAQGRTYSYTDEKLEESTTYIYRLVQTDKDGRRTEYGTVYAKTGVCDRSQRYIRLYPNPAMDRVYVSMSGLSDENVDLTVTDALGKLVRNLGKVPSGATQVINVQELTPGIYNVRVSDRHTVLNRRFIKIDNGN